jgi:ribosome-binding protein aMBF1 (putative translation factor)
MRNVKARRTTKSLTPHQQAKMARHRRQIHAELPEMVKRNRMSKEASEEPTLSGEIRRAVHASRLSLDEIAAETGITPLVLDEFLTGDRTLRSDVLDRLAKGLRLVLTARS